ncbi:hypothetical protein D3C86_986250 [compost metagenome]
MRLAHHAQGPAVGQGPAVVGRSRGRAVEFQLVRLPSGIVDDLGQLALLAQAIQQFGVGRTFVQPGRVDGEQGLEGGVVEGQPLGRAEDGHGVGQVVQGLVMGFDVTAQGVARLLGLGHVDGEGDDGAASARQRLGQDAPGLATAVRRHPAEALLSGVQARGLGHHGVGAAIKAQARLARLGQGLGAGLGQPGAVGPDQLPGPVDHPGRGRRGLGQGAQTRVRRCLGAAQLRQAQPGRAAERTPLDRPGAVGGFQQGLERLAALDQPLHLSRVGFVQRPDDGLGRRRAFATGREHRQGLGRAEHRLGRALGRQGQPHVVEHVQGAFAGGGVGAFARQPSLDLGLARPQPLAQPPGPGADRQRQTRCTRSGHIGDVGLGHPVPGKFVDRTTGPARGADRFAFTIP